MLRILYLYSKLVYDIFATIECLTPVLNTVVLNRNLTSVSGT